MTDNKYNRTKGSYTFHWIVTTGPQGNRTNQRPGSIVKSFNGNPRYRVQRDGSIRRISG